MIAYEKSIHRESHVCILDCKVYCNTWDSLYVIQNSNASFIPVVFSFCVGKFLRVLIKIFEVCKSKLKPYFQETT